MNDDNDHDVIRYTDVAADYAAARKLGAEPPDIPEQYLRHGNGSDSPTSVIDVGESASIWLTRSPSSTRAATAG